MIWVGVVRAGTELSERICVVGISMNIVTYLVGELHLSSAQSATIVTNFMGTLNLLGLLGGFVADAKLGRYFTVAISASITALVRTSVYMSIEKYCIIYVLTDIYSIRFKI